MNAVKTRTSDQFNLEIKMETRTAPVGDVPVVQRSKCTDAEKCKGERVRERRRWEAGGGGEEEDRAKEDREKERKSVKESGDVHFACSSECAD